MGALGVDALQTGRLQPGRQGRQAQLPVRPLALGLLAALALLGVYLGLTTLAQGWSHAIEQFAEDRWLVGAIVAVAAWVKMS